MGLSSGQGLVSSGCISRLAFEIGFAFFPQEIRFAILVSRLNSDLHFFHLWAILRLFSSCDEGACFVILWATLQPQKEKKT